MDFFSSSPPSLLDRAASLISWPLNAIRSPLSTLVSLPALSVLVIPTFGSYSTSLNLLFFYFTWSTLIFSHPPLKLELYGTLAIRLFCHVLPSLCFLVFDVLAPNVAIRLKEHGEEALPLAGKRMRKQYVRIVALSLFNVLLGVGLQGAVESLFTRVLHIRSALRVTSAIPLPWGLAKDLIQGLFLREVLYPLRSMKSLQLIVTRSSPTSSIAMSSTRPHRLSAHGIPSISTQCPFRTL